MKFIHIFLTSILFLSIIQAQNIGIGTNSPLEKLHVKGGIYADSIRLISGASPGKYLRSDADGKGRWQFVDFIADTDFSTKLTTQNVPNDETIRMFTGHIERWAFTGKNIQQVSTGNNLFVGRGAGNGDITNYRANTAFGDYTLFKNGLGTTGAPLYSQQNTAIGHQVLFGNTEGYENTAVGASAMYSNTSGFGNVAIGVNSLQKNNGSNNTAIGMNSLFNNLLGSGNTALGHSTMAANQSGKNNTALGISALNSNTDGSNNIAIGKNAMELNEFGSGNIGIGNGALQNSDRDGSIAIGDSALMNNGMGATQANHGLKNVAIGYQSQMNNSTGYSNTSVGNKALTANEVGSGNTAMGDGSLAANKLSDENTGIGFAALSQTTGRNNTATGSLSLTNNVDGVDNTGVGKSALENNEKGDGNTAIGIYAGVENVNGSYNTALGFSAGFGANNLVNATAVGANATVSIDNAVVLGNNANVGIGTSSPNQKLEVAGNTKTNGFIMTPNAGAGKALISDANGNGTWQRIIKSDILSIPASEFRIDAFDGSSRLSYFGEIRGYGTDDLFAPVSLPNGAFITKVKFFFKDQVTGRDLIGVFRAYQNGSNAYSDLASVDTNGYNAGYLAMEAATTITIVNESYSYGLVVSSTGTQFNFDWQEGLEVESVNIYYSYYLN